MDSSPKIPSLAEFLVASPEQVAAVAPATAIFAVGGTRRSAALAGVSAQSDDYARWSRERMIACFQRFFQLGVQHLFSCLVWPGQFAEVGRYREQLIHWVRWGLTGPEALDDFDRLGWRVRLLGGDQIPALQEVAARLVAETRGTGAPTLWLYVVPQWGVLWEQILAAAHQTQARTQGELLRALYGEEIPPAGVYIGFGKPMISNDLLPLALFAETQCYWTQRPGYELDDELLRRIFYDYAYRRRTWVQDKSARYAEVHAQRALWESRSVLGIGKRVGDFWYPDLAEDAG